MKRKLFISTMFLCLAACFQAWAQDVEGVGVGVYMTEEQIFAKFGEPDNVDSKTDDVSTVTKMYYYGANEVF